MGIEEVKAKLEKMTHDEKLDLLLRIAELLAPETEEEVNEFLIERGYDIDELNKRSKEELDKLLEQHKPMVGCTTDEP